MPDKTIEARLDAIEQQIAQATEALTTIREELDISDRIENANAEQITKLKRHVADLQSRARVSKLPTPEFQPTES